MKFKYIGVHQPREIIEVSEEKGKELLNNPEFKLIENGKTNIDKDIGSTKNDSFFAKEKSKDNRKHKQNSSQRRVETGIRN